MEAIRFVAGCKPQTNYSVFCQLHSLLAVAEEDLAIQNASYMKSTRRKKNFNNPSVIEIQNITVKVTESVRNLTVNSDKLLVFMFTTQDI